MPPKLRKQGTYSRHKWAQIWTDSGTQVNISKFPWLGQVVVMVLFMVPVDWVLLVLCLCLGHPSKHHKG